MTGWCGLKSPTSSSPLHDHNTELYNDQDPASKILLCISKQLKIKSYILILSTYLWPRGSKILQLCGPTERSHPFTKYTLKFVWFWVPGPQIQAAGRRNDEEERGRVGPESHRGCRVKAGKKKFKFLHFPNRSFLTRHNEHKTLLIPVWKDFRFLPTYTSTGLNLRHFLSFPFQLF